MARTFRRLVLALLLLGPAGESLAGIVVVDDSRLVMVPGVGARRFDSVGYNLPIDDNFVLSEPGVPDFGALIVSNGIAAQADQYSTLGEDSFVGIGDAFVDDVTSPVVVRSVFDVTFEVTAPSWFILTGRTFFNYATPPDPVVWSFTGSTDPDVVLSTDGPYSQFFRSGRLVPGVEYRLLFSESELPLSNYGTTQWSFQLAVPEPSPLELAPLLGLGLLFRRSCSRRRPPADRPCGR